MESTHATNSLPLAEAAPSLDGMVRLCEAAMADVNSVILEKMGSEVPLIPELAGHLIAAGGKRMRPMLTLMGALSGLSESNGPEPLENKMPIAALHLAAAVELSITPRCCMMMLLTSRKNGAGAKPPMRCGEMKLLFW